MKKLFSELKIGSRFQIGEFTNFPDGTKIKSEDFMKIPEVDCGSIKKCNAVTLTGPLAGTLSKVTRSFKVVLIQEPY